MSSAKVATVMKMVESLPEPAQEQVVEHLGKHIADLQDEHQWDILFGKTQGQLVAAAQRARQEIAEGQAQRTKVTNKLIIRCSHGNRIL